MTRGTWVLRFCRGPEAFVLDAFDENGGGEEGVEGPPSGTARAEVEFNAENASMIAPSEAPEVGGAIAGPAPVGGVSVG